MQYSLFKFREGPKRVEGIRVLPMEAVFSNLRVHMDSFWNTELIGKGLNIKTELQTFPRLMDEVSVVPERLKYQSSSRSLMKSSK